MKLTSAKSRFLSLRTAWSETLVLTGLLPAIGYAVNPADPFYLNNRFPWLITAPLLISLRYGFIFGMSSTFLLVCVFSLGQYLNWQIAPIFPVEMVVGMILITMIAAEFNDISRQKLQLLQHKYHYLELRMNEFSRAYHILKGSHSLLEQQQTVNYKKSMRNVLLDLQKQILSIEKNDGEPLSGIGDHILELFSEYGSIQTASVYAVSEDRKIHLRPVACFGNPPSLQPVNPLVEGALKTGHVTSIQSYDEEMEHEILVVIPLVDVFQKTWGLVVVYEMSMFALQKNTLDLLSLLGGHIGDLIKRRTEEDSLDKDVWLEFECKLRRVLEKVRSFKIAAAIIVTIVNSVNKSDELISNFSSELRGLDMILTFRDDFGRRIIIQLLPLTDEIGLKGFLSRLDLEHIKNREMLMESGEDHGYHILADDVAIYSWILKDTHSPEKILSKVSRLCQHNELVNRSGVYYHANNSS